MGAKLIIAFSGKAGNGKDSCVQAIIDARQNQPYSIKRYSFADALKAELAGKEVEFADKYGVEHQPGTKWPLTLQAHGEAMRRRNPFHWITQLKFKIDSENTDIALISDTRYKNELFWILSTGGYAVRVERLGYVDPNRDSQHKSEIDLDDFPFTTHSSKRTALIQANDGEAQALCRSAIELFDWIIQELDFSRYMDNFEGSLKDSVNWVALTK